jgi:hypothetical protein
MVDQNPNREPPYKDQPIKAILFDDQGHPFFVFLRIHTLTYKMAQTPDGRVFFIEFVFPLPNMGFEFSLSGVNKGGSRLSTHIKVHDYREAHKGAVKEFIHYQSSWMTFTDEPSWKPLNKDQIAEIALGFGYFCSGDKLTQIPEPWLAPGMRDYVYCDFTLQNGQMLALLVRTIETKPTKQEFVLAVDEHDQVLLVKKCEVHGVFSKEAVIDMCRQDGRCTTMRVPLTALEPEHRKSFSRFLALDCVKNLPNKRFDDLPEGVFEANPNLGA